MQDLIDCETEFCIKNDDEECYNPNTGTDITCRQYTESLKSFNKERPRRLRYNIEAVKKGVAIEQQEQQDVEKEIEKFNRPYSLTDKDKLVGLKGEICDYLFRLIVENFNEKMEDDTKSFQDLLKTYLESDTSFIFEEVRDYYSSYKNDIDINTRPYLWASEDIGQSITYPFENIMLNLEENIGKTFNINIFKIKFKKRLRLLNSKNIKNTFIFSCRDMTPKEEIFFINIFKDINRKAFYTIPELHHLDFSIVNNSKILFFTEVFNRLINMNSFFNSIEKIDGYKNAFDQNEIALSNFDMLPKEVEQYTIQNIIYKIFGIDANIVLNLPLKITNEFKDIIEHILQIRYLVSEDNMKVKIRCKNNIIINYKNIQNDKVLSYRCQDKGNVFKNDRIKENTIKFVNKTDRMAFWINKYLKYKKKYLNLKNQLGGIPRTLQE